MSILSPFKSWWDMFWNRRSWMSLGGGATAAQVNVDEDSALNYSAVWCATRLFCGTASGFPLNLYRRIDEERETKVSRRDHAVAQVLKFPNHEMTGKSFRSLMVKWQVNGGNAYAEVVREGNDPDGDLQELWPIDPCRVSVKRDGNGLFYDVHNEYGGGSVELEPWRMLHIPSIITFDAIYGMGVISHAKESIGAGIAAEKYGANAFGRGGMPQIVVEHDQTWNDVTRAAFRKDWEEIHSGADASRMALLQGGAKAKALGLNAQDLQFIESRQFSVEEIARWYGVPPHLLQHLMRATYNNVESLGIDFVRYSLMSWLELWEEAINMRLLRDGERDEYFVKHNVEKLLRGDSQARSEFYKSMTGAAIMTRNECRRLEDLDPVEGGDTYLVQGAMVPLDDEGKPVSKFVEGGAGPAAATEPDPDANTEAIAMSVRAILDADLSRMLTKESKAVAFYAKKPGEFVQLVDSFYAEHTSMLTDAVARTTAALERCGLNVSRELLVSAWIREGKAMVLEAAGTATPNELPGAIQRVLASKTWSERPKRAIEGVENATLGV